MEERPILIHRRTNAAEWNQLADVLDSHALAEKSPAEATKGVFESLRIGLMGWRNQIDPSTGQVVEFDPAKLECILSPIEAVEFLTNRVTGGLLTAADRKNSASPA